MDITASPTANGRYVELELEDDSLSANVFLTPEEVNDLQAKLASALDRLSR